MTKVLALAGAALIATTAGTRAGPTHTIDIDGVCTGALTLSNDTSAGVSKNSLAAFSATDCTGFNITGGGFIGSIETKKGTFEKAIILSQYGAPGDFMLTLSFPLPGVGKSGTFTLWSTNGTTMTVSSSGSYTEIN